MKMIPRISKADLVAVSLAVLLGQQRFAPQLGAADAPVTAPQAFKSGDGKWRVEGTCVGGEFRVRCYDEMGVLVTASKTPARVTIRGKDHNLTPAENGDFLSVKVPDAPKFPVTMVVAVTFPGGKTPERFRFKFRETADGSAPSGAVTSQSSGNIKPGTEVQEVDINVSGGYDPASIEVEKGIPVVLKLHRKDGGKCAEHFVIPDYGINKQCPGFKTTEVVLTPTKEGTIKFQCGMDMMHGKIVVTAPHPDKSGKQ
jgi:hypothetical protein